MIASFSASSPLVSVALVEPGTGGRVLATRQQELRTGASGMLLSGLRECLEEVGFDLSEIHAFAADTGPGSFIGTRVAVTLAKTLAYAQGKACMAASAFDLIDPDATVVIPNRRGEWFVRVPGHPPELVRSALPADLQWKEMPEGYVGYGVGESASQYPHASRLSRLEPRLIEPTALVPTYLVEPSISTPKLPYAEAQK